MSALVAVLVVVAAWAWLVRRDAESARHDAAVAIPHVGTDAPARLRVEHADADDATPSPRVPLATSDEDGTARTREHRPADRDPHRDEAHGTEDAPPAPRELSGAGQVVVRLRNPDGHEFVGRRLVLQAAGGRLLSLSTGSPTSVPVGVYRVVEPQDEAILGRLPRPLRVSVEATDTEVTWTLQQPLRLVRFAFPDGLEEGAILVVYDAEGKWVGKAGQRGDETVDLLLPETPLWASFRAGSRSGAAVSFVPAPPSDPAEPCMTVRWKD